MPIYEFVCESCGEQFEELVAAGTERARCHSCGVDGAVRVMSPPAEPPRLVKTPGHNRRLEEKRRFAVEERKRRFRERRRRSGEGGE